MLYQRDSAYPSQDILIIWVGVGGSRSFSIGFNSLGKLRIWNAANANIWTDTGSLVATPGVPYRFDVYATVAGAIQVRVSDANSSSHLALSPLLTGQSLGGVNWTHWRFGPKTTSGAGTAGHVIRAGAPRFDPAATGLIGPYVAASDPPVAAGDAQVEVGMAIITAPSVTPGAGGTISFSLSPMTDAVEITDGVWAVEPPAVTSRVHTWTATESGSGLTATGTATVPAVSPATAAGLMEEVVFDGGLWAGA
jgi:hypothetical protein